MKGVRFTAGLLQQLGVRAYLNRPAYFEHNTASSIDNGSEALSSEAEEMVNPAVEAELMSLPPEPNSIVFLGASLNSVFQDESKSEWLLMQSICQAFGWSEEQLRFFDTDTLASEESIFTTMEEVIEIGVEWVLSMDLEHPITEQLSEGVHVIGVPDLEQMLYDPYAKQAFYLAVSPHVLTS